MASVLSIGLRYNGCDTESVRGQLRSIHLSVGGWVGGCVGEEGGGETRRRLHVRLTVRVEKIKYC